MCKLHCHHVHQNDCMKNGTLCHKRANILISVNYTSNPEEGELWAAEDLGPNYTSSIAVTNHFRWQPNAIKQWSPN